MQGSKQQSLAEKCARNFPITTRNKGLRYYRDDRVALEGDLDGLIQAKVCGSSADYYIVRIDVNEPHHGINAAC